MKFSLLFLTGFAIVFIITMVRKFLARRSKYKNADPVDLCGYAPRNHENPIKDVEALPDLTKIDEQTNQPLSGINNTLIGEKASEYLKESEYLQHVATDDKA